MPRYTVTATRETYYEFEVEATDEHDAEDQVHQLELEGDIEEYAVDWYPIQTMDVEEVEEEEEE